MRTAALAALVPLLVLPACGDDPTEADAGDHDSGSRDGGLDGGGAADAANDGGGPDTDAGHTGCRSDADCEDESDCTEDRCQTASGTCRHDVVPALCDVGESCHPVRGCEMGRACAEDADCADDDACTTEERCDPAARVCVVEPLDGDEDGDPPRVCGGRDCDDSDPEVRDGAEEICDGRDQDCDGDLDEGLDEAVCAFCRDGGGSCAASSEVCYSGIAATIEHIGCTNPAEVRAAIGACAAGDCACRDEAYVTCACPDDGTLCDGGRFSVPACLDLSSSTFACGSCDRPCGPSEACHDATCVPCGGSLEPCCDGDACEPGAVCADATCVACGETDQPCCAGDTCADGGECVDARCVACGGADEPCCGGLLCRGELACASGRCGCSAPRRACGESCVDTTSDEAHCGGCGRACAADGRPPDEVCEDGSCRPCGEMSQRCCDPSASPIGVACFDSRLCTGGICAGCGAIGQPCCARRTCGLGATCGAGDTCVDAGCGHIGDACCAGRRCAEGICSGSVPSTGTCRPEGACTTSECDLFEGGCPAGEGCYPDLPVACVTEGVGADGDPCPSSGLCAAGHFCVGDVCREACCGSDSSTCPSEQVCVTVADRVWGICLPERECNPLTQTGCDAGEACRVFTDLTMCHTAGSGTSGDRCATIVDCAAGFQCLSAPPGTPACRRICDLAGGAPSCEPSEGTCTMPSGSLEGIGFCLP